MSISARRPRRVLGVIDDPFCVLAASPLLEAEFQSEERDQDEAASTGTAANVTRAAVPTTAPVRAVTESFIVPLQLHNGGGGFMASGSTIRRDATRRDATSRREGQLSFCVFFGTCRGGIKNKNDRDIF